MYKSPCIRVHRSASIASLWLLSLLVSAASAFTTPPSATASVCFPGSLLLHSSRSNSQGSDSEDELSKLIGKRNQIKRKRVEDMEAQIEHMAESLEPVVDFDLSSLPELKTTRTARPDREAEKEMDKKEMERQRKELEELASIVDFMADYDDENDFHIPNRIGITTAAWGDVSQDFVLTTGKGDRKLPKNLIKAGKFVAGDVLLAHRTSLMGGISLVETSPAYGAASSKQKQAASDLVQQCLEAARSEVMPDTLLSLSAQTTAPWKRVLLPWRPSQIVSDLETQLAGLDMEMLELFTLPKSRLVPSIIVAKALAAAAESGLCQYVGVEGVTRLSTLRSLKQKLEEKDVSLTSNSFEFSLTNRKHAAMIDACKALGVIPFIRNPLDNGLASGVFTAANPSGGQASTARGKFSFKQLEKVQPLHSVLETVAQKVETRVRREASSLKDKYRLREGSQKINTNISTTQVALNYVVSKGGVPLVPVNTQKQAEEVLGCLGWTLNDEEITMLDAAAALCEL